MAETEQPYPQDDDKKCLAAVYRCVMHNPNKILRQWPGFEF
jgi:hypothetical protein